MTSHHPEDEYRYGTGPQDDVPRDAYVPPFPGGSPVPYPQQPHLPPGHPHYPPPGSRAPGSWTGRSYAGPPPGYQPPTYAQPGYPPPYAGYPPPYAVAPKSPAIGALASFFLPGLGSMINGDVGKGLLLLLGFIVSTVLTIIIVGFVGMLIFWIWGMVDGYRGAQRWNLRHGIVS